MDAKLRVYPAFYRRVRHYRDRIGVHDGRPQVAVKIHEGNSRTSLLSWKKPALFPAMPGLQCDGLKAQNMPAQGNAMGTIAPIFRALKGRPKLAKPKLVAPSIGTRRQLF